MSRNILVLCVVLLLSIPVSAQDAMMMAPGVEVQDQVSLDETVTVASAYSDGPGFIVIHADNGSGAPGPVIGHQALSPGANSKVRVEIDTTQATPTLFAMLHSDTNEIGVYEFGTVDGADGPVQDANGNVITPPFKVDLIYGNDQPVQNNSVTIASVVAQVDGWLVVHQGVDGAPGPVAGYAPVSAGNNRNVVVNLDMAAATEMLFPMLHVDTGTSGTYEFQQVQGADGPVAVNGVVAVTPIWTVPHMRVDDQIITHADGMSVAGMTPTLTAESVLAAQAGWLVVHSDNGQNAPGPVAGYAPVQAGTNLDVDVQLDPAMVTPRLFPMLHVDSGQTGVYEFGTVQGADGPVTDSAGNVIVFGIDAAPSIDYEGDLYTDSLEVDQALMDSPGWLVIHANNNGSPGQVLGEAPLYPGLNENIEVPLDAAAAGTLVFPMLHVDSGQAGVYEFGTVEGADLPVSVGGQVVVGPMQLGAPQMEDDSTDETMSDENMAQDNMTEPSTASCEVSSGGTVNLRQGPGTNYSIVGSLSFGQTMSATGQAQGTDGYIWWNLSNGAWVRSDVVEEGGDCAALAVMSAPAAPAVAPPVQSRPQVVPPPAQTQEPAP